jgi:hypothetical protein
VHVVAAAGRYGNEVSRCGGAAAWGGMSGVCSAAGEGVDGADDVLAADGERTCSLRGGLGRSAAMAARAAARLVAVSADHRA